jgi:hypothetical protein
MFPEVRANDCVVALPCDRPKGGSSIGKKCRLVMWWGHRLSAAKADPRDHRRPEKCSLISRLGLFHSNRKWDPPTLLGPLPRTARWRDLDENNIQPVEIEGVSEEVQRVGWRALITCARPRGRVGPENT